jgi:hypothetical protein
MPGTKRQAQNPSGREHDVLGVLGVGVSRTDAILPSRWKVACVLLFHDRLPEPAPDSPQPRRVQ